MRNIAFLLLLLAPVFSFAREGDTTFHRHQLVIGESNAMSHVFADGPSGPTTMVVQYGGEIRSITTYLPNYVLHIHVKYSLGLTRHVRLETGLGYMFEGLTVKSQVSGGFFPQDTRYSGYSFSRKFSVPLYAKFTKRIGAGSFTCTVGPEFTFPVNTFIKEHNYTLNGVSIPNQTERHRYSSQQTISESSMGVNLKMGYETYFPYSTVDVGPVVNFSDLLLLDKGLQRSYRSSGYRPYHYYIGVDVSVYFGVKGKKK